MDSRYALRDTSQIVTPAMVVFADLVESNLDEMLRIAGDAARLRPHCKTHKMPAVVKLELGRGITRHKCATLAEAEMLAEAGATDILLAYPIVGANIPRAVQFVERYPEVRFAVIADHRRPIEQLASAVTRAGRSLDVLLDLDTGQHRTGVEPGPAALDLYRLLNQRQGLRPGGLHVYDGQNHQTDLADRRRAVLAIWDRVVRFRDQLMREGCRVPRVVAGGTGSFPIFASLDDPTCELSPGTCVFHDAGYLEMFPDLKFAPAALLLTRVVSRPAADLLTLDLGYKAVASDPPLEKRVVFPDLPGARTVLQNEEHLVLRTPQAEGFLPGDELLAIPRHVCPTSALHRQVYVIRGGDVRERWDVTARDRWLTV